MGASGTVTVTWDEPTGGSITQSSAGSQNKTVGFATYSGGTTLTMQGNGNATGSGSPPPVTAQGQMTYSVQ
jgi:hypothetical protein